METIKNYLESMFVTLPNTDAVRKAKRELLQMMEDKYNELIESGINSNEAVGTVISEFGNLEELAESLGVSEEVNQENFENETSPKTFIPMEKAQEYLSATAKHGYAIGLGVLLCIISFCPMLFLSSGHFYAGGIACFFIMIAAAVGLFVYSSITYSKWDYVVKKPCYIDMTTAKFLSDELDKYTKTHALRLTIGIILCVICWLPLTISHIDGVIGMGILNLLVGYGVMLIIVTNSNKKGFERLLSLNNPNTVGGHYAKNQEQVWLNDTVQLVMELYWPVITSIYLCWSFLSFDWGTTWVIWPVAGVIHAVLKKNLVKNRSEE